MLPNFCPHLQIFGKCFSTEIEKKNGAPVMQINLQDKATLLHPPITRLLPRKFFKQIILSYHCLNEIWSINVHLFSVWSLISESTNDCHCYSFLKQKTGIYWLT